MIRRLVFALALLASGAALGQGAQNISTRGGVVTGPNRPLTFPMPVRFSSLVATNLSTLGYTFPSALGSPGQGLTVSADGLSLIFKAADGVGDMLKSVYDADNNLAADSADALGGLLATNYATKAWVTDQIAAIPSVDLSDYATQDWVDAAIAAIPPPDLSGYATTAELDEALAEIPLHDPVTSGDDFVEVTGQVLTLNTNAMDTAGFAMDSAVAGAIATAHPAFSVAPGTIGSLAGQEYSLQAADITAVTDLLYAVIGHGHTADDITSGVFDLARIPTNVATDVELADAISAIPPVDLSDYVTSGELATEIGLLPFDDYALVDHVHDASEISSGVLDMLQIPTNVTTDVELADAISAIASHAAVTLDPNSVGSLTGQSLLISTNEIGVAARSTVAGVSDGTKFLRDDWSWEVVAAGGLGGSTGSEDTAILRANGAGGVTVQPSALSISDPSSGTQQKVIVSVTDPAATSALVLTPKGGGALIVGPPPDGGTTGGSARGTGAKDFQFYRTNANQVAQGNNSFIGGGVNNRVTVANGAILTGENCAITGGSYASAILGGYGATITGGQGNIVGGNFATASGNHAVALGYNNRATNHGSKAFGYSGLSSGTGSVELGYSGTASGNYSVTMGKSPTASHANSMAIGLDGTTGVSTDRVEQLKVYATGGVTLQTDTGTMTHWGKRSSAPVSGVDSGDMYYDTTDNKMYCYDGSAWQALF